MITLYGLAISNYYNKVKLILLEKQIAFSEVVTMPSQEPSLLERSPLGKIPFIETAEGKFLSESQAIVEYLEDAFPEHPLYPANPFERAKAREIIQHLELNVELIARRIYLEAFFGGKVSDEVKEEVKSKVETGLKGLTKLLKFAPYALGEQFTMVDIVAWPHLQLIGASTQIVYGNDLVVATIPEVEGYLKQVESRPTAAKVNAERAAALAEFLKAK